MRIAVFATLLLAGAVAGAPPAGPAGPDYRLAIPHEEFKLPNGLRVVLSRDNGNPVVGVCVIYDVGTRSEEKGHTGYAHLLEHVMAEAPANAGKGEITSYIRTNGGQIAAAAHPGYSIYSLIAPSNQLATVLWMEAGRMSNLSITPETLKARQDAIREERLTTVVSYNAAILEGWPALVFGNPQNSHSPFGVLRDVKPGAASSDAKPDDVSEATVEEVTKFYKTWYVPSNAVLSIAGDFQTADVKKLVEQYFGGIPSQPTPQHPDVTEQPRAQGKALSFQDPRVGLPSVVVGWQAPERHSPQWYALQMVDAILTKGQTARLPSNLVQGRRSLLQFQSGVGWPYETAVSSGNPSEYAIFAVYRPGLRAQLIAGEIQQEIDDIAGRSVETELTRIKAALRVLRVSQLQNSLERATLLAQYSLLDGKLSMLDDDFVALMAVTVPDVQQVARRLLNINRRDVMFIDPAPRPAPRPEPKK